MIDLGCLGLVQSRFRLFRNNSRPISAFLGHRPRQSDSADTTRFWLNWPGSARQRHAGSSVGRRTPHRAAADSGVAPSQPHRCFIAYKIQFKIVSKACQRITWFANNPLHSTNFTHKGKKGGGGAKKVHVCIVIPMFTRKHKS